MQAFLFLILTVIVIVVEAQKTLPNVIFDDVSYVLSASLPAGQYCGPQKIKAWRVENEALYGPTGSVTLNGYLRNGIWTAPVDGFYHICASARIKQGSHGDMTIILNPNPFEEIPNDNTPVESGFGSDCPSRCKWSSFQTCINSLLTAGNTVGVFLRSGGYSDCIEQTNWKYAKLEIFLILPTNNKITTP